MPTRPSTGTVAATGGTVTYKLDLLLRQQLAEARLAEMAKSPVLAYGLWLVFGVFGAHRFYLRSTGVAVGQLCTLGGLGIWSLVDVFFIGRRLRALQASARLAVYEAYGLPGPL